MSAKHRLKDNSRRTLCEHRFLRHFWKEFLTWRFAGLWSTPSILSMKVTWSLENKLYLLLNAILNSLYLVHEFCSRMFVRRLLITNAIQFSPKNISSVISRTRFGCKTDLVADGTLTSMSEYSLAYWQTTWDYISYQLCLQCINLSLDIGLVRLKCLFVWFPASEWRYRVRCLLWAGWSCCPAGWSSYEFCVSIWGSISRHSGRLRVISSDTWKSDYFSKN